MHSVTLNLNTSQRLNIRDKFVVIDTEDWIVYGYDENYKKTGSIYN